MNAEKVNLIIRNMESLLSVLKQEISTVTNDNSFEDSIAPIEEDYDEVYVDEV